MACPAEAQDAAPGLREHAVHHREPAAGNQPIPPPAEPEINREHLALHGFRQRSFVSQGLDEGAAIRERPAP
jgi:hypothetical protein